MMRKFIHKEKGSIATLKENYYCITTTDDDPLSGKYIMPKRFIEQQTDVREEVIEKDWINEIIKDFWEGQKDWKQYTELEEFLREIILKHSQKVKKFTEKEIKEASGGYKNNDRYWAIYNLLNKHNLLSTDDND